MRRSVTAPSPGRSQRRHVRADTSGVRRLGRPLLALADDLLARGLLELTYAIALGQPERAWVTAADVAKRHTFGIRPATRRPAWELPAITTGLRPGFGVTGSLLGLDAALADMALVRLSSKPPPRRPMLADVNRKAFIQAATLVEPAWLTDDDLQRISWRRCERVASGRPLCRRRSDALALAADLRLSPSRGSLLSWMVAHDPERVAGVPVAQRAAPERPRRRTGRQPASRVGGARTLEDRVPVPPAPAA